MKYVALFSALFVLTGCENPVKEVAGWGLVTAGVVVSAVHGRQSFDPPPDSQDRWAKNGASNTEVVKALLECGDTSPRANFAGSPIMTANDNVLSSLCMEASGFTSDYDDSAEGTCRRYHDPKPTACAAGTLPPARDINRRIHSAFCKTYPKAQVCVP